MRLGARASIGIACVTAACVTAACVKAAGSDDGARPAPDPAPRGDAVYFTDWSLVDDLAAPNLRISVDCEEDLTISASCDFQGAGWPGSNATPLLTSAYVDEHDVAHCVWSTHDGLVPSGTFRARALCFRL